MSMNADEISRRFNAAFGKIVQAARKRSAIRQQALGDYIGLSRPSIANIEHGRQGVSLETAMALVTFLKLDLRDVHELASHQPDPKKVRNARIRNQIAVLQEQLKK